MSQWIDPPARPGDSLGVLLTRLRQAQGKSQVRLAGLLCAASGLPTLTRHEISRWEREERIPSRVWLGWLALVLDTPLDDLERAAALTRRRREPTMIMTLTLTATTSPPGATAATGTAAQPDATAPAGSAAPAGDTARSGPGRPDRIVAGPGTADGTGPATDSGPARPGTSPATDRRQDRRETDAAPDRRERIAELRRMDDLLAGPELLALVLGELRSAARDTAAGARSAADVAELTQLHAWVAADAGRRPQDGVQRQGVRAALAAGDRALAGHLLGCHAHLVAERGDGPAALRFAGTAERVAAGSDPATATVLPLRVAFAAARAGDRHTCDAALARAQDAHARRVPGLDPPWLYWLDTAHVDALAGLCLAASGRPEAALSRLAAAAQGPTVRLRAAGLVSAATAEAHLATGDLDAACAAATMALLMCVDSGSFRVLDRLRRLGPALHAAAGPGRPPAALRAYADLAHSAAAYLPGAAPAAAAPAAAAPAAVQPAPTPGAACLPDAARLPGATPAAAPGAAYPSGATPAAAHPPGAPAAVQPVPALTPVSQAAPTGRTRSPASQASPTDRVGALGRTDPAGPADLRRRAAS